MVVMTVGPIALASCWIELSEPLALGEGGEER
jgi:hypothetical protein